MVVQTPSSASPSYRFGVFELDPSTGELRKKGLKIRLQGQPVEILIMLLQRPGEVVTREELQKKLWPADTFVDFEQGLNNSIKRLRAALDDDAGNPHFVETLPRRGYRFIGSVNAVSSKSESSPAAADQGQLTSATLPGPGVSGGRKISFRNILLSVAIVLAVSAAALVFNRGLWSGSGQPIQSLAVLPLKNLSGDSAQDYLADGMTEELIGRLAAIPNLRVISRTSIMRFKDTQLSIPEIAKALNVDAVIEGSVLREGDQIRVQAQLIRAATEEHVWVEEYQREYRSALALQEDISGSIAERVETSLTSQRGLAPASQIDPEAHENYLKGRYYFNQRTVDALNKSIAYFNEAIAKNPDYALAYSGLADDYAVLGFRGGVPSKDALSRAKAAALKAVELDDKLADAHASLAFIAETHEWDWATAEREYKRALTLNPNDARSHHWYAGYLVYVGRFDEGVAEEKRARDLDPLSLPINNALAGRLLVAGRYDEALNQAQKTLELDSHFPPAHQTLGWVYLNRGKRDESIREFGNALQLSGSDNVDLLVDLGFAYAAGGKVDEAGKILAKLKTLHEQGLAPSGSVGIVYGAMGNLNEAFAWLAKACQERDPELTYIKVPGRRFEPLRHDRRYLELVRCVGLPD